MIRAFQELYAWLNRNGIEPRAFKVVVLADPMTTDRIAIALGFDAEAQSFMPGKREIREGQICGLSFSIEPIPSWREKLAADLDEACAIDVSATGINRGPHDWWKTRV
jgi:hypothetical protein